MLFSIGIVVLIACVFAGVIHFGGPERSFDGTAQQASEPDPSVRVVDPEKEKPKPTRRSYGYNPYERQHEGFLGFNGYKIIHDAPDPVPATEPAKVFSQAPVLIESDSVESYSDIVSDTGTGIYQPEVVEYLSHDTVRPVVTDREVQVVKKVDPEYPLVAIESQKEGQIAVIVYIDSTGQLSTYPSWLQGSFKTLEFTVDGEKRVINYAMAESPPDWFFGKNFLKVLPEWEFLPRIEKGLAVGSVLTIKYYYCLGVHCLRYELISQKD